jgi:hypothetical protein
MTHSDIVWLPCEVQDGMFTNEFAVQINVDNLHASFFVDGSLIHQIDGRHYVSVRFMGDNGKPGYKLVLLPTEAFETGSKWLSVPERMLDSVPA